MISTRELARTIVNKKKTKENNFPHHFRTFLISGSRWTNRKFAREYIFSESRYRALCVTFFCLSIYTHFAVFVASPPLARPKSERQRVRLPEEMLEPLLSPFPRLGLRQQEVSGRLQRDQMFFVRVEKRFQLVDELPSLAH